MASFVAEKSGIVLILSSCKFQSNQQEFEQLAELLSKYPMAYALSKFDVGNLHLPLHLPFKTDNFSKNNSQVKYQFFIVAA